jgi:tRNA(Arg) A34 adenosine deaminase TadA
VPTIVEIAYRRILHVAAQNQAPAAAAWRVNLPLHHALTASPNIGHSYDTPIVNLLQSHNPLNGSWIVASYPVTAACLGMARLLGVRRIIYRGAGNQARAYELQSPQGPNIAGGGPFVAQFDPVNYALEAGGGNCGSRVFPDYSHTADGIFTVQGAAQNLLGTLQADQDIKDNCGILLAFSIASALHGPLNANPRRRFDFHGQNIASVLVNGAGQIIGWGVNTNRTHASLHGEVNAIRAYQRNNNRAALPANGRLYTTLEPCAMCSGMLVHCAGQNAFTVVCGQRDAQVTWSALQARAGVDGDTGNARHVTMEHSQVPHLPWLQMADSLTGSQRANTPVVAPPNNRWMQTTRFLEQHAKPMMTDASVLLEKMAAVWIPQGQRGAWRAALTQFLQSVVRIAG